MGYVDGDYEASRSGSVQNQLISVLSPTERGINLVLSGQVSASVTQDGNNISVDTNDMQNQVYKIRGAGFRKGLYTETLLSCVEVRLPFKDSEGELQYVRLPVADRTYIRNYVYLWAAEDETVNVVSGSWLAGNFAPGPADNYFTYEDNLEEFDYTCKIARAGNVIFINYEHPTYLTTDPYNPILGNAMAESTGSHLYSPLPGGQKYKNQIKDYHKFPGVGAKHVGELTVDNSYTNPTLLANQYFESFIQRAREDDDNVDTLQTLELPFISYRAISASVYVDRFEGEYNEGAPVSASIKQVWEDLQAGNVDDSETVYFIERAKITGSAEDGTRRIVGEQKTTIPVVGSILFNLDGNIAVRHSLATVYAPFINTVYRTNRYGVVTEMFSSKSLDEE